MFNSVNLSKMTATQWKILHAFMLDLACFRGLLHPSALRSVQLLAKVVEILIKEQLKNRDINRLEGLIGVYDKVSWRRRRVSGIPHGHQEVKDADRNWIYTFS